MYFLDFGAYMIRIVQSLKKIFFYFVFSGWFFNEKGNLIPLCFMTRRDSTEILIPMAQLCHHATTKFTEHGRYVKIHPKNHETVVNSKNHKKSSHGKSSKFSELLFDQIKVYSKFWQVKWNSSNFLKIKTKCTYLLVN